MNTKADILLRKDQINTKEDNCNNLKLELRLHSGKDLRKYKG